MRKLVPWPELVTVKTSPAENDLAASASNVVTVLLLKATTALVAVPETELIVVLLAQLLPLLLEVSSGWRLMLLIPRGPLMFTCRVFRLKVTLGMVRVRVRVVGLVDGLRLVS